MQISPRDMVFICGKSGSGKSHFVKTLLLPRLPKWILWDYKHEYYPQNYRGCIETHDIHVLITAYNRGAPRIIFKPWDKSEFAFNTFCACILQMVNTTLIVEEVDQYATSYKITPNLKTLVNVGSSGRGIGLITIARRTKRVNPDILSNAHHIIAFRQLRPEDLQYLAAFVGNEIYKLPELPQYYFIWYFDGSPYTQEQPGSTHIMSKI